MHQRHQAEVFIRLDHAICARRNLAGDWSWFARKSKRVNRNTITK